MPRSEKHSQIIEEAAVQAREELRIYDGESKLTVESVLAR
jgi:hypothetical protein